MTRHLVCIESHEPSAARVERAELRARVFFDSLTQLPNRALLHRFLVTALTRDESSVTLLTVDLDGFKRVNDTLGRRSGDALLREVARRLTASIRGALRPTSPRSSNRLEDLLEGDVLIARMGGGEFGVAIANLPQPEEAASIARRIGDALASVFVLGAHEVFVTSSIGIATSPDDASSVDELVERSGAALFAAREKGRNNFRFFTGDLLEKALRRMKIENGLRGAMLRAGIGGHVAPLEPSELHLVLQPKVDLRTHEMTGAEVLLRWASPELGRVSPAEFIPIAEEAGLIVELGEWVLRSACLEAVEWARSGRGELAVSVNVSARQIREPDFAWRVAKVLEDTGLAPHLLELEITEGVVLQDPASSSRMLDDLKRLGLRISLDDFGTGYSSLSYLTRLPIDALKIDRSFVAGLGTGSRSELILKAMIGLSHGLALDVVVEGVESEEELAFLARHGGELQIQGFLIAKPMSRLELEGWALGRSAKTSAHESGTFVRVREPSTMRSADLSHERRRPSLGSRSWGRPESEPPVSVGVPRKGLRL